MIHVRLALMKRITRIGEARKAMQAFVLLILVIATASQEAPSPQPLTVAPNLMRLEGVDAASGIHYVRLILYLPSVGGSIDAPPRFIMECTENKGKRDLAWFVSFGAVSNIYFTPPFRPTPQQPFPSRNPSTNLKMTFEGYTKWKPYTRSWEILPFGELRYRNPGVDSPNMDSPRFFVQYLNSLSRLADWLCQTSSGKSSRSALSDPSPSR
jgi:hypothetical protein